MASQSFGVQVPNLSAGGVEPVRPIWESGGGRFVGGRAFSLTRLMTLRGRRVLLENGQKWLEIISYWLKIDISTPSAHSADPIKDRYLPGGALPPQTPPLMASPVRLSMANFDFPKI